MRVREFYFESEEVELPLSVVLNGIAFDIGEKGRKFDANFISRFNQQKNEFEYYI